MTKLYEVFLDIFERSFRFDVLLCGESPMHILGHTEFALMLAKCKALRLTGTFGSNKVKTRSFLTIISF